MAARCFAFGLIGLAAVLCPTAAAAQPSLHVEPAVNGYVIGPGLDCGAGRTDCDEAYTLNSWVTLHATPSPGYMFLGWAGGCNGGEDAYVFVNGPRVCVPVFNVAPGASGTESPDYSAAALFLDGFFAYVEGAAPPVGQRVRRVFIPAPPESTASTIRPDSSAADWGHPNGPGLVQFIVDSMFLSFRAAPGTDLTSGTYYSGMGIGTAFGPSCDAAASRFRVYEYTFDSATQTVVNFAADFELPCEGRIAAGSIRYRSSRASLLPFDGVYPVYTLRISSTLGGYVTATTIDCGDGGRADCQEEYTAPQMVSLQATASPGYLFAGWAGSCGGGDSPTTVLVSQTRTCIAIFTPTPGSGAPPDPTLGVATLLIDTLDSTSAPTRRLWVTPVTGLFLWSARADAISMFFYSAFGSAGVNFSSRNGALTPGDSEEEYSSWRFYLDGCYNGPFRYRIHEIRSDAAGNLLGFAADFEVFCKEIAPAHLAGSLRYNATRGQILPFDGEYPLVKLSIEPAPNGVVTSAGIDCGPGRADCTETYESPGSVTLQATPLAGYRFVGWSGACNGGSVTTVTVDRWRSCSAVFNAAIPGLGVEDPRIRQSSFLLESEAGERVGGGLQHIWLDAAVTSEALTPSSRGIALMKVRPRDGTQWYIYLRAPGGQELQAGSYDGAIDAFRSTPSPGLHVAEQARSCSSAGIVGRFVIHEISFESNASNRLASLSLDFEQRCTSDAPVLRGAIRFRSARSVLRPFAPTVFTPVVVPDAIAGGSPGFVWRHAVSGRNAIWLMDGVDAGLMSVLAPSGAAVVANLDWEIRAAGDVNADGNTDLIWQNSATGRMAVWYLSGTTLIGTDYLHDAAGSTTEPDLDWKIVGAGDMDRDGHVDVLWRHRASGEIRLWHMKGIVQQDSVSVGTVSDTGWTIVALADVDGDAMLDLLWRHNGHGGLATWFMSDALPRITLRLAPAGFSDTRWRVVGAADMNGDQRSDLVWQHGLTGELGVWFMDGTTRIGGRYLNPARVSDANWQIVAVR